MKDNGTFKNIHRKIVNWEWYHKSEMVHLFLHLLLKANYRDKKWKGITIKRGQLATGLYSLNRETGISIQTLRTCLSRLQKTGEINKQSNNQLTIITICKYDEYESEEKKPTSKLTNDQQATNKQLTTTNKDNKDNKDNNLKYSVEIEEIILYLNQKADKNFRSKTDETRKIIKQRIKEGFSVNDFKKVIDKKSAQWLKDPEMDKFLRPQTLFGKKFESYLNEKNNLKAGLTADTKRITYDTDY